MDHRRRVYEDIFEMMPSEENPSPMVRINRLNTEERFPLYAKLEWMNPFGSVKDRPAYEMLRELEESGQLGEEYPERGVVEPTSGNTGISLAAMSRAKGYHMRSVIPERVPEEKKLLLRIAGAELDVVGDALCPVPGQSGGTVNLAKTHAKAQKQRYTMPNQYENRHNIEAHRRTTGPEIWRQTGGAITHLFVSLGTCGTVTGVTRYLKERNPEITVIAVQPTEGHDVPGLRNVAELSVTTLYEPSLIDEILEIDYELAYRRALELSRNEGLLAGPSSGLVFEGARRYTARDEVEAGHGVMIFCDNVFKYASAMQRHLPELQSET
jgi:cysteine synthase